MQLIPQILIFGSCVLGTLVLASLFKRSQSLCSPEALRPSRSTFGSWTPVMASVFYTRESKKLKLQRDLLTAGIYHSTALNNFLAIRNAAVMGVVLAVGYGLYSGIFRGHDRVWIAAGIVLATFVFCVPRIVLAGRARRRAEKIENAFPDFLDMLSISIESGMPVELALSRVARKLTDVHPSLCQELDIIERQAQIGSVDQAFDALGSRIEIPELVLCATTMRQANQLGVGISNPIRSSSERMRETRRQNAEREGELTSLKLLLPVVLCLVPPVFILLIGPAILDFKNFINREKENVTAVIEHADVPSTPRVDVDGSDRSSG